ncbi:MAG: nucleotidyltransferase domain-containing protein [Deltaproteobacteria bacterium]|nr:nucleotidyltransferase domain-containing protein [Deltaproteobacteria bacterium]
MYQITPALLQEITKRLVDGLRPQKIILFGSRAWGKASETSDVDLLVIVSDSRERPARRAMKAHRLMDGIPVPLDILVKTLKEVEKYRHLPSSLENQILKNGKVLYG